MAGNNETYNIEIVECDPTTKGAASIDPKSIKFVYKNEYYSISKGALAISCAKAMLTNYDMYHGFSKPLQKMALSYFHTIDFFLCEGQERDEKKGKNEKKGSGYWAINHDYKDIFRDFSKTARIGELAQGLSYYYFIRLKDVIAIRDYHQFVKDKIAKKPQGRTPDYVLVYRDDNKYGLLEAKGTMDRRPRGKLASGYQQAENGKRFLTGNGLPVKDHFTSAVWFSTSSNLGRRTEMYIMDPTGGENEEIGNEELQRHLFYEWSKLAYLTGDKVLWKKMWDVSNGEGEVKETAGWILKEKEKNAVKLVGNRIGIEIGKIESEGNRIKVGVDKNCLEALGDGEMPQDFGEYMKEPQRDKRIEELGDGSYYIVA